MPTLRSHLGRIIQSFLFGCRVLSCGFVCEMPDAMTTEDAEEIIHGHSYDIHLESPIESQRLIYRHTVSSLFPRNMAPKKDQSTSRIMTNDPYFNTTVSIISDRKIFFPAPHLYKIDCSYDSNNASCLFGNGDVINQAEEFNEDAILRLRISHDAQKAPIDVRSYWVRSISSSNLTKLGDDFDGIDSVSCQDSFLEVRFVFIIVTNSVED